MQYRLILGNRTYSGWSLRVWLVFKHFDLEFEYEVVPLYTDEYEKFSREHFPARQLPTLIANEGDRRQIIWDSLSIVEFLHERHPEAGIWPVDAQKRAAARSLCAEVHSGFKAIRSKMPVNLRRHYRTFQPDGETLAEITRVEALWRWARSEFDAHGRYLLGDKFTVADAFFAPIASRFRTYSIHLGGDAQVYMELLLEHPATVQFIEDAQEESWIMEHNEFDLI